MTSCIVSSKGDGVSYVQETFRCYTKGHSLVGNNGDRWMVGRDDLVGLFQS